VTSPGKKSSLLCPLRGNHHPIISTAARPPPDPGDGVRRPDRGPVCQWHHHGDGESPPRPVAPLAHNQAAAAAAGGKVVGGRFMTQRPRGTLAIAQNGALTSSATNE